MPSVQDESTCTPAASTARRMDVSAETRISRPAGWRLASRGSEPLHMQRSCWPARAARLHRHQQRLRPAAVHERAGGWLTEELIEVEQARLVLRLEQDPVPVPGPQLVAERHRGDARRASGP